MATPASGLSPTARADRRCGQLSGDYRLSTVKRWNNFPPDLLLSDAFAGINNDAEIAAQNGSMLELRVSSESTANMLSDALKGGNLSSNVIIKYVPGP